MLHVDVCRAVASVPCSLVVNCWERADLLAVVCVVFCYFPKCVLVYIRIEGKFRNVSYLLGHPVYSHNLKPFKKKY